MNDTNRAQFLRAAACVPLSLVLGRPSLALPVGGGTPAASSATWVRMPGLMAGVAAGFDGSVYALGLKPPDPAQVADPAGRLIFKWNASAQGWDAIPGLAVRLAVSNSGELWAVNARREIFRTSNAGASWRQVSGSARDIASRGETWALGVGNQVFKFSDPGWLATPMRSATNVAAGITPGDAWAVGVDDKVYRAVGAAPDSAWAPLQAPPLQELAVDARGRAWGISWEQDPSNFGDFKIVMQTSGRWVNLPGAARWISASRTDIWVVSYSGAVFRMAV